MSASSIDTFLACSIMIVLVSSAMAITSMTLGPYLNELSHKSDIERYQQLAKYILLNPGTPSNWGSASDIVPDSFGLALANSSHPYELDVDAVSRLSDENVYALTYPQILEAFGVRDVALRMEIKPIFALSVDLITNSTEGNWTTYIFEIETTRSQLPISAELSCYVISKNYIDKVVSSTSPSGNASVSVALPNSANGTALLISFAKAENHFVTFNVYYFGHNSFAPEPDKSFMRLSPLSYTLNVSFSYPNEEIHRAQVFTHNYTFEMTKIAESNYTAKYRFPHLLDPSLMILAITGSNGTSTFAEWVSYPQLPIEIGVDLSNLDATAKIVSLTYVVTMNLATYEFTVKFVGPR